MTPYDINTIINNIYKMDSSHYIGYSCNFTGDYPYLLLIFNKEGDIIKTYPNHQKYIDNHPRLPYYPGLFYEFDNHLFFKEYEYNDTVFKVNLDTIIPHIVFDLGEKKPDYYEKENTNKNMDCYWIKYVRETKKYIFFSYNGNNEDYYDGFLNKENGELAVSLSGSKETRGFIYDNNIYPPLQISSINKSENVISIITPTNMLDYIEKNKQTVYPEKFYSLELDDNPIIVIATLK